MQLDWSLNIIALSISGGLLCLISIFIARAKTLFSSVLLLGSFSMIISLCYLLMDAPDVAMTEVALGSCLSTCVMLNMLQSTASKGAIKLHPDSHIRRWSAIFLCLIIGGLITWQGLNLAVDGDAAAPVNAYTTKMYLEGTSKEIGIPAFVAAILGSYRGFDTLGETAVIALAGTGVMLIMAAKAKNEE